MKHPRWVLLILLLVAAFMVSPALRAGNVSAKDWSHRLEALGPSDPLAYFLLAEEIADVAGSDSDTELARRLFALSAALAPERLGRSACIALTDMTDDEHQRRRFAALASLLLPDGGAQADPVTVQGPGWLDPEESAVLALGDALSFYRRGIGTRAAARLNRADAVSLLQAVEHALPSGTARNLLETSPAARVRPRLTTAQTVQMLQLEAALLAGRERTWSSDLVLTRSNPLIDVDPARLDEAIGIDATRPRYRNGRWVE